jgi:hypothetical protein
VSSLSDRLVELKKRAGEITKQITSLADKRKSYAFAAATGDAKARKQITDVDFEVESLRKEEQTVASAVESGEALIKQQELDAEAAERREREVEAHRTAQAISALNCELDARLKELREAFERRASLFAELAATGIADLGMIMRLGNKYNATSSAQLTGLGRYLNLEMVPAAVQRPLADSNSLLLSIGKPPVTPRVVLKH